MDTTSNTPTYASLKMHITGLQSCPKANGSKEKVLLPLESIVTLADSYTTTREAIRNAVSVYAERLAIYISTPDGKNAILQPADDNGHWVAQDTANNPIAINHPEVKDSNPESGFGVQWVDIKVKDGKPMDIPANAHTRIHPNKPGIRQYLTYSTSLGAPMAVESIFRAWYPEAVKSAHVGGFTKSEVTTAQEAVDKNRVDTTAALLAGNVEEAMRLAKESVSLQNALADALKKRADEKANRAAAKDIKPDESHKDTNGNQVTEDNTLNVTPPMGETLPTPPTPPTGDLSEAALKEEAEKRASTNA